MTSLQIDRVTGGFIIRRPDDPLHQPANISVACCLDDLTSIVRAWASGASWVPPIAPDAAPAQFRVGDRVVFRDKGRRILENAGPWTVDAVSPYRTVLLNVFDDLRDWWVDECELRHAPEEV